jgi:hypothetical protein
VAVDAYKRGYHRIDAPHGAEDDARNGAVLLFMNYTAHPDSWLVLLDIDHIHPESIVHALVTAGVQGVVGAAYRRRGTDPADILARVRDDQGDLVEVGTDALGAGKKPIPVVWVGTGAIAIQRWVFDALRDAGGGQPFFEYEYEIGKPRHLTCDVVFCEKCEEVGVPVACIRASTQLHVFLRLCRRTARACIRSRCNCHS